MKGKTDAAIQKERNSLIAEAKSILLESGEIEDESEVEVIDSFFADAPKNKDNIVTEPVWWLGRSLMKLSEADVAIFGDQWEKYNGCSIEHEVCQRYGILIVKD